jgi:hypothetical protein
MGPANLLPAAPNPTPGGPVSKNTSRQRGEATSPQPKAADARPRPDSPPLNALDAPMAPPRARDLVAALSSFALGSTHETKILTTISQCPNSIRWCVELLARRARCPVEAAVAFLLTNGLPKLWLAEVDEMRRAREHILAHGTTEDRHWVDACLALEISSAGTGYKRYVVRIADRLRSEAGLLASVVALPLGEVLILGVMAGLVNADVVPPKDRPSLVKTLRAFRQLVQQRAVRARMVVDATPITSPAQVEAGWTLQKDLWTVEEDGDE